MRTTKEELAWLRCLADEAWEGRAQETLRRAIDDADRARMADDAVSTIALAAGLPADASAEEVAARVTRAIATLKSVVDILALPPDVNDRSEHADDCEFAMSDIADVEDCSCGLLTMHEIFEMSTKALGDG